MRNVAAFHVDTEIIDKGLNELVNYNVIDVVEVQGEKDIDSTLSLGAIVLFNGLGMSLDEYGAFVAKVTDDNVAVSKPIQTAFLRAAEAAGVLYE